MCIRDRKKNIENQKKQYVSFEEAQLAFLDRNRIIARDLEPVSYTHLRAHETVLDLVCRLLLEKKKDLYKDYVTHWTEQKYQHIYHVILSDRFRTHSLIVDQY